MHIAAQQGVGVLQRQALITGHGVHVVHIFQTDIPNRREVVLYAYSGIRNSNVVLHLGIEVTVKGIEAKTRDDRPVAGLLCRELILGHLVRVASLGFLLL